MLSPWLSVWGLVADMAGVAIITWDVWPEYRLHRVHGDALAQHRVALAAIREAPQTEEPGVTVKAMLDQMCLDRLNSFRRKLGLTPIWDKRELPSSDRINESLAEVERAAADKRVQVADRNRPPIGLGFILVLAGFGLQLTGAWPR